MQVLEKLWKMRGKHEYTKLVTSEARRNYLVRESNQT